MTYAVLGQHIVVEPVPTGTGQVAELSGARVENGRFPTTASDLISRGSAPNSEQFRAAVIDLHGRVVDSETKNGIPGLQVFLPDLAAGAITDLQGGYTLRVPAGVHELIVSGIGYRPHHRRVVLGPAAVFKLDLQMTGEALALDQLIVTGTPGRVERRAIGNVVERIPVAAITRSAPILSVEQALNVRAPGVILMAGAGGGRRRCSCPYTWIFECSPSKRSHLLSGRHTNQSRTKLRSCNGSRVATK